MTLISILHPFTPEAVGLDENNFLDFHSQPHFKAAQEISKNHNFEVTMDYFTSKRRGYTKQKEGILYRFYPVSRKWNGDHLKWKKQTSKNCFRSYRKDTPDVTIINMSGHSSPFSYELSEIILDKNKYYIAMLGGQHYSDIERNRLYYRRAHHLLVHTYLQKIDMEKRELFKSADIKVFPLGVNTSLFKPLKKKGDVPSLLYVGRIISLKRIHLAILSVKQLREKVHPESHLKIIGPISSPSYYNQLLKLIKELDIEENISFLGPKPHFELPKYFQEANLLVLPSDKETFGMVMVEAMACGTPVAGMNCAAGPLEIINNGHDGILTTPETYSADITNYYQSWQNIDRLSYNAREKVLKEYNLSNTFEVFKESIFSIVKN